MVEGVDAWMYDSVFKHKTQTQPPKDGKAFDADQRRGGTDWGDTDSVEVWRRVKDGASIAGTPENPERKAQKGSINHGVSHDRARALLCNQYILLRLQVVDFFHDRVLVSLQRLDCIQQGLCLQPARMRRTQAVHRGSHAEACMIRLAQGHAVPFDFDGRISGMRSGRTYR